MRRLLNVRPKSGARLLLGLIPLAAIALIYLAASTAQHSLNPSEKILPTVGAMVEQVRVMALQVDPQTGAIPLWQDTAASLRRLGAGLAIATALTLVLGLVIGVLPLARAGLGPLVAAIAVIPPIAVLPILFITFGLGETAKIVLIVVGVTPFMVRDLAGHLVGLAPDTIVLHDGRGDGVAGVQNPLIARALQRDQAAGVQGRDGDVPGRREDPLGGLDGGFDIPFRRDGS